MATASQNSQARPVKTELPPVPAKRYFTIGEVSELCQVKQHVLRYWEQEFSQLKPMKRRGNRRYYQHHEVMLIRRIRALLYDEGFTISGARSKLEALRAKDPSGDRFGDVAFDEQPTRAEVAFAPAQVPTAQGSDAELSRYAALRAELIAIRDLLT